MRRVSRRRGKRREGVDEGLVVVVVEGSGWFGEEGAGGRRWRISGSISCGEGRWEVGMGGVWGSSFDRTLARSSFPASSGGKQKEPVL